MTVKKKWLHKKGSVNYELLEKNNFKKWKKAPWRKLRKEVMIKTRYIYKTMWLKKSLKPIAGFYVTILYSKSKSQTRQF